MTERRGILVMKHTSLILVVLSALQFISLGIEPVGRITWLIGEVGLHKEGRQRSLKARLHAPVHINDTLVTGVESRCEISCNDGIVIRTDENGVLVIAPPRAEHGDTVSAVKAAAGAIWVNARKLAGKRSFDLYTPTTAAGIRGTAYNIDCGSNSSDVMVFDGVVELQPVDTSASDSIYTVSRGERFAIVRDLDQYLATEREQYLSFQQEQQDAYEQFLRDEQSAYDEFVAETERRMEELRQTFTPAGSVYISKRTFNVDSGSSRAWIDWNLRRDR